MHKAVLIANAHKKQRIHRGGGRNFSAMQKDIGRFLKQDSGSDVFFTSMIDLYVLHKGFPGIEEAEIHRSDPYCRVRMLEEFWASETEDPRFIPHIQLHEYEAYLFVDVSVLSNYYQGQQRAIAQLEASVGACNSPELIDDGPETAPSKRIIRHCLDMRMTNQPSESRHRKRSGCQQFGANALIFRNGWNDSRDSLRGTQADWECERS